MTALSNVADTAHTTEHDQGVSHFCARKPRRVEPVLDTEVIEQNLQQRGVRLEDSSQQIELM